MRSRARYPCRFICPRPMAWPPAFAFLIDGTDSMSVWSETPVRARMATSTDLPKSGESIDRAMFIEPRLQEMSRPTVLYERSSLYSDGVETCRISEHRFECVILPAIGLARFTVSSNMTYG